MRIAHVITGLGSGGAERMLTRIATHPGDGEAQSVISLMDAGVFGDEIRSAGATLTELGLARGRPKPSAAMTLARALRAARPDIVMSWLYHADLLSLIALPLAGLNPRRRLIWNIRCTALDFDRHPASTKRVASILARASRIPAALAANSVAGAADHAAMGYKAPRWCILPNGLDLDRWRPRPRGADVRSALGLPAEGLLIGMAARRDPQKDHDTFFAAAERLAARRDDVRFALIGEGVDALAPPPALDGKIVRLGYRRDMPELMAALDLHVLSSAYGEGFPNAIVEAMASGAPCVSTDVGDASAIIGDTGSIAPIRDPDALSDAMAAMIGEPDDRRERRRAAARARIAERYDVDRVRGLYSSLWRDVATGRSPSTGTAFETWEPASGRPSTQGGATAR